jgi:hypothetical protein
LHECRDRLIEKENGQQRQNDSEQDAGCDLALIHQRGFNRAGR